MYRIKSRNGNPKDKWSRDHLLNENIFIAKIKIVRQMYFGFQACALIYFVLNQDKQND